MLCTMPDLLTMMLKSTRTVKSNIIAANRVSKMRDPYFLLLILFASKYTGIKQRALINKFNSNFEIVKLSKDMLNSNPAILLIIKFKILDIMQDIIKIHQKLFLLVFNLVSMNIPPIIQHNC